MKVISRSVKETLNIGRIISRHAKKGDIICLLGELGSGKTVLTKGIASGLGIEKEKVISPTFVLIRQYAKARLPLYHFDLYRLAGPDEIFALGYSEYFYDDGLTVVEWADRLGFALPEEYLSVELSIRPGQKRLLDFKARGKRYKELLGGISEDLRH